MVRGPWRVRMGNQEETGNQESRENQLGSSCAESFLALSDARTDILGGVERNELCLLWGLFQRANELRATACRQGKPWGEVTDSLMKRLLLIAALVSVGGWGDNSWRGALYAQQSPAVSLSEDWQLETIRLQNDREYRGLVLSESPTLVEFAAIMRRPGRAMFTVVIGVEPSQVVELVRLQGAAKRQLVARYERFKRRVPIMLGRMEELDLQVVEHQGVSQQRYEGAWFTLTSTANDEMTRRCIVRMEQMMLAFRQVLPPRQAQPAKFAVRLFGSSSEYRGFLSSANLTISNPAFYSQSENLIAAGCDLMLYSERLDHSRQVNEGIRRQCLEMDARFAQRKRELTTEYRRQGLNSEQIKSELDQQTTRWIEQKKTLLSKVKAADRRNQAMFHQVTDQMFRRLYHEAFHAYLENHVFPSDSYRVPRWLNEGLAQVFESGQLDGDVLRIDAPDAAWLADLKRDLARGKRPAIADMLQANENQFLRRHGDPRASASYRLSWGVVYYLLFSEDLLTTDRLTRFVAAESDEQPALDRFEALVDTPFADFSDDWAAYMRKLR